MFKCLVILAVTLSFPPVTANTDAVAALAFTFDGSTHVAVFDDDGVQRVDILPDFMLFGRYDVTTITPEWTADGRLIGTGYDPSGDFENEPKYEAPAIYLKSYDIHTSTFTAHNPPITPLLPESPTGFAPMQILTTNSLSPDGSYATFFDVLQANGYLVDLQSDETLFNQDCSFKALIWEPERVLLGKHGPFNGDCKAFLMWVDLNTGAITTDYSEIVVPQHIYQFDHAVLVNDHQLLVAANNVGGARYLGLIEDGSYRVIALTEDTFQFAPDNSGVVFYTNRELKYIALQAPFKQDGITDIPKSQIPKIAFDETGSVLWGSEYRIDGSIEISRNTYEPGLGTSAPDVFYAYDLPHRWAFAPDMVHLATLYDERLVVYAPIFRQVWSSTPSGLKPDMSNDAVLYWADDRRVVTELADYAGSLVGDLETDAIIPPPEPGARLINISPDGRWWLYLVPDTVEYQFDFRGHRLIAYDSTTSETHAIKDASDDARFLLVEGHEFVWWTSTST